MASFEVDFLDFLEPNLAISLGPLDLGAKLEAIALEFSFDIAAFLQSFEAETLDWSGILIGCLRDLFCKYSFLFPS